MTVQSSTMAEQEGGWPLGLQRLNRRVSLARSLDMSGSRSFSSLLTSTAATSSLSSEAHSLPYSVSLSRRSFSSSMRGNIGIDFAGFGTPSPPPPQRSSSRSKQAIRKCTPWFCCLCLKRVFNDEDHSHGSTTKTTMTKMSSPISLGHLLEEERIRAMGIQRRSESNVTSCITS